MAKRGRPPLRPSERRTKRYTVSLDADTKRRFDRALEQAGNVAAAEWFYRQAIQLARTVK